MSTQHAQGVLLFLVLAVNSARFRILRVTRSYSSCPFLCTLDMYIVCTAQPGLHWVQSMKNHRIHNVQICNKVQEQWQCVSQAALNNCDTYHKVFPKRTIWNNKHDSSWPEERNNQAEDCYRVMLGILEQKNIPSLIILQFNMWN